MRRFWRWLRNLDKNERLSQLVSSQADELAEITNLWWMACETVGIPGDSSGGRFRDAVKNMRQPKNNQATCELCGEQSDDDLQSCACCRLKCCDQCIDWCAPEYDIPNGDYFCERCQQ